MNDTKKLIRYMKFVHFRNRFFNSKAGLLFFSFFFALSASIFFAVINLIQRSFHFSSFESEFIWVFVILNLIFTLNLTKINNAFNLWRGLNIVVMGLKDATYYRTRDYIDNKGEISNQFKGEFVKALEKLHDKGYKTIRMKTHQWVVVNVIQDPFVQTKWKIVKDVEYKRLFSAEVLELVSDQSIRNHPVDVRDAVKRVRKAHELTLKRIG